MVLVDWLVVLVVLLLVCIDDFECVFGLEVDGIVE